MPKRNKKHMSPTDTTEIPVIHGPDKSPHKQSFKIRGRSITKLRLMSFVAIFAVIGTAFLLFSHASTAPVATAQAEQMVLPAGASVIPDSTASGLQAVKLSSNGVVTGSITLPSGTTAAALTLTAHANKCHGWASLSLSVDGKAAIPATAVSSSSWTGYSATIYLASGTHTLDITGTNIGRAGGCYRSLYLDVTNLFGPTVTATPAPTIALSASPASVAAGGSSTLTWSSTNADSCTASNAWSGAQPISGSATTGALNSPATYSLTCTGVGGSSNATASVAVSATTVTPTPSPVVLPACTTYASPSGTGTGAETNPTSLMGSYSNVTAGSVVCLKNGVYSLSTVWYFGKSGAPGKPIVYRSQSGKASDVTISYTGALGASNVIQLTSGASYDEFYALTIDGQNKGIMGFKLDGNTFHDTMSYNIIRNVGSCGIGTIRSDYITTVGNLIHHTGYDPAKSWCSGISYNTNIAADTAPGFHSFIIGNIISGTTDESSYHSDGGGIIMDLGGNIPATLIANNVTYNNGSQCINLLHTANIWVVNNTCYKNRLDLRLSGGGEIDGNGSDSVNNYYVNNAVHAWTSRVPFSLWSGATGTFSHNIEWGGNASSISGVTSDAAQIKRVDPKLASAPAISEPPTSNQQYTALEPWSLADRLLLLDGSPAINGGVDPRTLSGATAELRVGMDKYLPFDIRGIARPTSGGWDVGAYEK